MKRLGALALALIPLLMAGCHRAAPVETGPERLAVFAAAPETTETVVETEETEPTEGPVQPEQFLLTFAGDCTLGSNPVNYYADYGFIKTVGEDYGFPFRNVIDYFEEDDFTMVNLEGALCDEGNPVKKRFTFRGPTAYTAILTQNSVEAVTVANNHALDYGEKGYASTLEALDSAGIPYVERDSSRLITTERGLTIGLYGMVYYKLDVEDMVEEIRSLREQGAEVVIVAPHWGVEYTYRPTEEQKQVAHAAIDAGADIVFGTHPHVLQPVEFYGDGVIFYSLGNFSFGGNGAPGDYDTALLHLEILRQNGGGIELGELTRIPACISSVPDRNNFQPTPLEPGSEAYNRVLSKLDGTFEGPNLKIH